MKFRTRSDFQHNISSPVGSRLATEFKYVINDLTGTKVLVEKGKTNVYDKIQEHADSCKLETIVRRYVLGDDSVLNRIRGEYFDATEIPGDLRSIQNVVLKAREDFEHLPAEIKQRFGNDINVFIKEMGSSSFFEKLGIVKKAEEKVAEPVAVPASEKSLL